VTALTLQRLGTRISGVGRIAELWRRTNRLRCTPPTWSDLAFDGVEGG
jgi:hypothetical protein